MDINCYFISHTNKHYRSIYHLRKLHFSKTFNFPRLLFSTLRLRSSINRKFKPYED